MGPKIGKGGSRVTGCQSNKFQGVDSGREGVGEISPTTIAPSPINSSSEFSKLLQPVTPGGRSKLGKGKIHSEEGAAETPPTTTTNQRFAPKTVQIGSRNGSRLNPTLDPPLQPHTELSQPGSILGGFISNPSTAFTERVSEATCKLAT